MALDPADPPVPTRVGETLAGKWTLEALLGEGGMGVVYAARHRNGKRVAVKLLRAELSRNDRIRKRFLSEGYAANRVEHPNAVSVLDDDVDEEGTPFLVMELLEGETTSARAARMNGKLPVEVAVRLCVAVLDVLASAHERGVVHRDIKPENLFLTVDGAVKVLDFGIARVLDGEPRVMATGAGVVLGTPEFMAPEQAAGRVAEVGPQSDLFSVGATLYTLLSGQTVHTSTNMNEAMVLAATRPAGRLARRGDARRSPRAGGGGRSRAELRPDPPLSERASHAARSDAVGRSETGGGAGYPAGRDGRRHPRAFRVGRARGPCARAAPAARRRGRLCDDRWGRPRASHRFDAFASGSGGQPLGRT